MEVYFIALFIFFIINRSALTEMVGDHTVDFEISTDQDQIVARHEIPVWGNGGLIGLH